MPITALANSVRTAISSGQVITTVESVVKELVENSIDACATNIEIKLVGAGLLEISVKDNGTGITAEDTPLMAQRYTTSKHASLAALLTHGFRGEALHSLCQLSNVVHIATRTELASHGQMHILSQTGLVISTEPFTMQQGTSVIAYSLFHTLPVRKQLALKSSGKTNKNTLDIVKCYKFQKSSKQNDDATFIRPPVESIMASLAQVFSTHLVKQLVQSIHTITHASTEFVLTLIHQTPSSSQLSFQLDTLYYLNFRSITRLSKPIRKLFATLRQNLDTAYGMQAGGKNLFMLISIKTDPGVLDVNIEPGKDAAVIHDEVEICQKIEEWFEEYVDGLTTDKSAQLQATQETQTVDQNVPGSIEKFSRAAWSTGTAMSFQPTTLINANTKHVYLPYQPATQASSTIPAPTQQLQAFTPHKSSSHLTLPKQTPSSILTKSYTQRDISFTPTSYEKKVLSPNTSPRSQPQNAAENKRLVGTKYVKPAVMRVKQARRDPIDWEDENEVDVTTAVVSKMNAFYQFMHSSDFTLLNQRMTPSSSVASRTTPDAFIGTLTINSLPLSLFTLSAQIIAVHLNGQLDPEETQDTLTSIAESLPSLTLSTSNKCTLHSNSIYTRIL